VGFATPKKPLIIPIGPAGDVDARPWTRFLDGSLDRFGGERHGHAGVIVLAHAGRLDDWNPALSGYRGGRQESGIFSHRLTVTEWLSRRGEAEAGEMLSSGWW